MERKRSLRLLFLILIGVLLSFSVPWYRAPDAPERLVFGFPDWMVISFACYAGVAALLVATWWLDAHKPERKTNQQS